MPVFIINRLFQALGVILVMSVLVFVGLYLIGDPTSMLVSPEATEIERQALRKALGLDQSIWVQYLTFLENAVQGDFGRSFLTGQPALQLIIERMPATVELVIVAMTFSVLVGVPLGILAGLRPKAPSSKAIMTGSILGFSLPNFWIGLMLIMLFAVYLGVLPASARGETVSVGPVALSILTVDGWQHLALPALTLGLAKAALMIRVTRAATREVLPMDYIKFARAKGLRPSRILNVHLLKNILIPIITVAGLEFGQAIAFAVVTESVFSWPGMGKLLIDSIITLDRPVVVAYLIMMVFFLVILNLVVDILYMAIDPGAREKVRD
ncbi:ABC transporter permease [Neorhizobium galegae]|uniref:ABC transporter permease n=1 Tax=Neorhizobium galegae TaxID=399 RepID=UPI00128381A9|nr:ABC transporter permease [Neorhizobium galegae]KAA9383409.1 ABC transporter permease [Neorhizobium galegae]MCM2500244.1 ABC transporter permease [Neorhizobium galegae]